MTDAASVRPARPREIDRLTLLWMELAKHHATAGARFALRAGAEDGVRRHLETRLADPDSRLLVADLAGDLPGLCVARVLRRPAFFVETERGEVEAIVVREAARRRGVGRALAAAALAWLRERGIVRVEVQVACDNRAGQGLWRALGFDAEMDVLGRSL